MSIPSRSLIAIALLAALVSGCAGAAYAQSPTPSGEEKVNRTITVNGSGQVYLTPDIAYVTIGVHTEGEDAAKTVNENSQQAQRVIAAIKGLGIDEKDIRTTNFSIFPQQEYDQNGKPTGKIRYIVDNSVFVTVRKIDQVGAVLDAAVRAGANSISGIQFDVANKTAALSEARRAAVAEARAKAEELARAAGVTLGEVQTISEYSSSGPVPQYAYRGAPMMAEAAPCRWNPAR